ncbi:hypothetical protein JXB01_02095 [Candidatus Micrarchaeota archaeon]|nr:hypothetical protein [Candidatus Micrarchaeota archaeon]
MKQLPARDIHTKLPAIKISGSPVKLKIRVCIWTTGSTNKDGTKDFPIWCKEKKCRGFFINKEPKCERFMEYEPPEYKP